MPGDVIISYRSSCSDHYREGNMLHENAQEAAAPGSVTKELLWQLHKWRAHLPPAIAWNYESKDDIAMSNSDSDCYREATTLPDLAPSEMLDFKTILNASLRTRYKYAEYIIWRPYIFRVLHSPYDSAKYDVDCCRSAFKVDLRYSIGISISLTPTRRLVVFGHSRLPHSTLSGDLYPISTSILIRMFLFLLAKPLEKIQLLKCQ